MIDPPRPIGPRSGRAPDDSEFAEASDAPDPSDSAEAPGEHDPEEAKSSQGSGGLRSVRESLGITEEEPEAELSSTRILEVEGVTWEAEVIGIGKSGTRSEAGAPLLLVRFTPRDDGGPDAREGWAVGRELGRVPETDLVDLLGRARPV